MYAKEWGGRELAYVLCGMWSVCYHCPVFIPSLAERERGIRTQQETGASRMRSLFLLRTVH